MALLCTITALIGTTIGGGCIACMATVAPPGTRACNGSGPLQCDTIVMNAEGVFYLLWGSSWVLVAIRLFSLLRAARRTLAPDAAKKSLQHLWGSSAVTPDTYFLLLHLANAVAPVALLTYGPFLILYVYFYATSQGLDVTEVYSRNNIGLIYHSGVFTCHLMTCYLTLNVPKLLTSKKSM